MRITITQVIEELTRIQEHAGDIEFESTIRGEIVEVGTAQCPPHGVGSACFATANFRIVAVADQDGYPVLPSLVVTPISRYSMATLDTKTEEFQRRELAEILELCSPEQRKFFNETVFPNGVPKDQLVSAYGLCERTLKKSSQGR
jgi:hypothetical protein